MTSPLPSRFPAREARFPPGSRVQIAELADLARFLADWKQHHPLEPEQLDHAGEVTTVANVIYYHTGDPLYSLNDVPGTWHEPCLRPA